MGHFKIILFSISNRQFGFLKGKSTVTQLLSILEHWMDELQKGVRIGVMYILRRHLIKSLITDSYANDIVTNLFYG